VRLAHYYSYILCSYKKRVRSYFGLLIYLITVRSIINVGHLKIFILYFNYLQTFYRTVLPFAHTFFVSFCLFVYICIFFHWNCFNGHHVNIFTEAGNLIMTNISFVLERLLHFSSTVSQEPRRSLRYFHSHERVARALGTTRFLSR